MTSLDIWQAIGVVCGSILAAAGVLFLAVRGLRMIWKSAQRLTDLLDQLQTANRRLDTTNKRLDATNDRLDATNARLDAMEEQLAWRSPAAGPIPGKPNTGTPPRRTR